MKSVVCFEPDAVELSLCEREADSFILDPETYYYFRDKIFIERIEEFIRLKHPNVVRPASPADSPAEKVDKVVETQRTIIRHYKEWRRQEPRYYEYLGHVYSFVFHGFINVGNEIEVLHWEPVELAASLDKAYRHPIRWALKRIFKSVESIPV